MYIYIGFFWIYTVYIYIYIYIYGYGFILIIYTVYIFANGWTYKMASWFEGTFIIVFACSPRNGKLVWYAWVSRGLATEEQVTLWRFGGALVCTLSRPAQQWVVDMHNLTAMDILCVGV